MKTVYRTSAAIMAICLSIGFILISFTFVAFNRNFYQRQAEKNNSLEVLSVNQADLDKVIDQIIAYFSGKSDVLQVQVTQDGEEINFYTEDELSHMVDVKVMFKKVIVLATILLIVGVVILGAIIFLKRKESLKILTFGFLTGNFIILGIALIAGIGMLIDFNYLFGMFHEIFFPQGNFSFDSSSNMIRLLPESLFMQAAMTIIVCGVGFIAVSITAGFVLRKKSKKIAKNN